MSQDHRFDEVVKAIAGGMSRRDVLRLIGAGIAGTLLASLGLGEARAATPAARNCHDFCKQQGLKGRALHDCEKECRADCKAACKGLKGKAREACEAACKSCGGDASACGEQCCAPGEVCINGACVGGPQ